MRVLFNICFFFIKVDCVFLINKCIIGLSFFESKFVMILYMYLIILMGWKFLIFFIFWIFGIKVIYVMFIL